MFFRSWLLMALFIAPLQVQGEELRASRVVLSSVNEIRAKRGLGPLKMDRA